MFETILLWLLVLVCGGLFVWQCGTRARLIAEAPNTFAFDHVGPRLRRWLLDVVLQRQTIRERPIVGLAHAFVFWGFVAFGGYTVVELAYGLGIMDLRHTRLFTVYRAVLTPFSLAVLVGILLLLVRRALVRPVGLGQRVSIESLIIAVFIITLMVTFILGGKLNDASLAGRINWWLHTLIILAFVALIPASKHLHLVLAPLTVLLKSLELGNVPNLDFEREQVGLEVVKDLGSKTILDSFTCVECGRCQVNCPAWLSGRELNPKNIILQTRDALLNADRESALATVYGEKELWQCTTCGACENQCPVGIEHLPILIGSRRGLVSNGKAADYLGPVYTNLERRSNVWGLSYDQRQRFVESASIETFDPTRHTLLIWLGCAGAFDSEFQKSLRAMFDILKAKRISFGVLAKERCTGDPAKRTGNEYVYQELAAANIAELKARKPSKIVTSCPHCVKTIGEDYRKCGYHADVVHAAVYIEELTRGDVGTVGIDEVSDSRRRVTYHDPCYLARYAGKINEPRVLLERFGAQISEPERNRENPYCCGAGGGLMFANKEEEPGSRISDVRFGQLVQTGAGTVVTACPFCSIMLKGAQASASGASDVDVFDIMTYVSARLKQRDEENQGHNGATVVEEQ